MKPVNKVKYLILLKAAALDDVTCSVVFDDDAIEEAYDANEVSDAEMEVREGTVETDIPCESSRHYESKSVAAQLPNGEWVGWTYWYGGGKHGNPEEIDWIEDAYDLTCVEAEKTVTVQTFTKV